MSIISRLISFFPSSIMRGAQAQAPIATGRFVPRASRDAGARRGSLIGWSGPQTQNPAQAREERKLASRRTADLAANDWAAGSALSAITMNAIGTDLVPQAAIPAELLGISVQDAEKTGKALEWAFARWCGHADAAGQLNFADLQLLGLRTMLSQGEMLHLAVSLPEQERIAFGSPFSLAIQAIRPERLQTPADLETDPFVRDGIRFSASGRPLSYFIANPAPGFQDSFANCDSLTSADFSEIPWGSAGRRNVFHLFRREEEEQIRGVSAFAPGIALFRNLSDALNNELMSQAIAASFSVFIETESPSVKPYMGETEDSEEEDERYERFEPGRVYYGNKGQKPQMLESSRPGSNFASFVEIILRAMAASQGIPYETLVKDYSKTNYSSMRAALNEAWKLYSFYRAWFGRNYCQPIWEMVCEEAILRGMVRLPKNAPDFASARDLWCNADWRGPARGFVDPVKEVQSIILALQNNLMTYGEAWAERGGDFGEACETMLAEKKMLDSLGGKKTAMQVEKKADQEEDIEKAAFEQGRVSAPDTTGLCQAAFRAVCSDADYQAGESLLAKALELKLDAAQLKGVVDVFRQERPAKAEAPIQPEPLLSTHPAPLNAHAPAPQAKSSLVADAEARRGGK